MTPTTPDPIAQFAALRPTDADLAQAWPADRQAAVLDRVRNEHDTPTDAGLAVVGAAPARRMPRRRLLITAGGIAAAAAAILIIPLVVPSGAPAGPPTAAALEGLAVTAAAEQPLHPGQYRHAIVTDTQNGHTVVRESWTSADGTVWRHDSAGQTSEYYRFPPGGDDLNYPSPSFLAGLPTDPTALGSYLRSHVHGSSSRDEAVFVAVGDMLRGGFAPPALRAAALRVLEATGHVTAAPGNDPAGQPAIKVSFVDQQTRAGEVQTLYFDPVTARIIRESMTAPGITFQSVVTASGIVDAVPPQVLKIAADNQGVCIVNGKRQTDEVCARGFTAGAATTAAVSTEVQPTK